LKKMAVREGLFGSAKKEEPQGTLEQQKKKVGSRTEGKWSRSSRSTR